MSKVWLAGATGFLGSHVLTLLRQSERPFIAVSRAGGNVAGITIDSVDVLDENAVAESASGCELALICTGKVTRNPDAAEELHRLHVLGTRSALTGLRRAGVRRVVLASTSGTIAVSTDSEQVADETAPTPLEIIASLPYYRSKLYAEREALERNDPPDFEVIVVNPSLLLGPGDLKESSTKDVRLFLEGSILATPAGGIALVDARDAAQGMLLALDHGRAGERYILNAKNMSIAAFFQRLESISGVKAPRLSLPSSRALAVGANRLFSKALRAIGGEPPVDEASVEIAQYFWYASSKKAERELGWVPRDVGETLRDTIDDLIQNQRAFPKGRAAAGT